MILKYCKDCKWSTITKDPFAALRCTNPKANAKDSYELSRIAIRGKDCSDERRNNSWFGVACGLKGKLFEPKQQLGVY